MAVRDLVVHPRDNDLILATHGRGVWILDDITAVQQAGVRGFGELISYQPRPAVRYHMWQKDGDLPRQPARRAMAAADRMAPPSPAAGRPAWNGCSSAWTACSPR